MIPVARACPFRSSMHIRILCVTLLVSCLAVQGADKHQNIAKRKEVLSANSLKNLSDVNLYQPPMHQYYVPNGDWIPLGADVDNDDLEAIMGSRPFREVLEYLSRMSKDAVIGRRDGISAVLRALNGEYQVSEVQGRLHK